MVCFDQMFQQQLLKMGTLLKNQQSVFDRVREQRLKLQERLRAQEKVLKFL